MPDAQRVIARRSGARRVVALALVVGAMAACADDGPASPAATTVSPDAPGAPDAGDAGASDAGAGDAGASDAGASDAGAGDAGASDAGAGDAAIDSVRVQSLDNTFRPEVIEIVVGTEVEWTNVGRNEHDVTPADGGVDGAGWGVTADDFGPGATYRHVFTEPGEYRYFCSLHGTAEVGQIGTIVVRAASAD